MTRFRSTDALALVLLAVGFAAIVAAPTDALQGLLQRLMYAHVPAAWLAYLAFAVTLVASIGWLRTRRARWDHLAVGAVEVGVFFTGLALVLGSVWGKPVWGVWWTWDARLVTTALLFLVYLGYLALRRATEDPRARANRAAVLGIIAFVQVPIVHFSVVWWRTLHQPATVLRPGHPTMDHTMLAVLVVNVAAYTAVFITLLRRRIALARREEELERGRWSPTAPVAGDAVEAPLVEGEHRV
jgi:heme exporter protein C